MYHLHHILMHHGGNNRAGADASSTEPYQRDSLPAFIVYWLRFALGGWIEVRRTAAGWMAGWLDGCLALLGTVHDCAVVWRALARSPSVESC